MNRRPWWHLRSQPEASGELNEPDPEHTVLVATRLDTSGDPDEYAWCDPAAADQWNAHRWGPMP